MDASLGQRDYLGFTLQQSEFVAQDLPIQIVPFFDADEYVSINGLYGPFETDQPVTVPIWLALELKRARRCSVTPYPWLNIKVLKQVLEHEQQYDDLQPLHFYYFELSRIFLHYCADDIPEDVTQLRTVLRSIQDIRIDKVKKVYQDMENYNSTTTPLVTIKNAGNAELIITRPSLIEIFNVTQNIKHAQEKSIAFPTLDLLHLKGEEKASRVITVSALFPETVQTAAGSAPRAAAPTSQPQTSQEPSIQTPSQNTPPESSSTSQSTP